MSIAVYTAHFGQYDTPPYPPAVPSADVDFIYFTDQLPESVSTPWQVRLVAPPVSNPKHASRYYFDQSTVVLPDHTYTIMHGANAHLLVSAESLIETYMPRFSPDIAMFRHPHRSCLYKEVDAVVMLHKDVIENITPQIERYRTDGFPEHFGLSACTFIIRRNTPALEEFEQAWWQEVSTGSHRDQLSFDYVRWKLNFPITYIPGDVFCSSIFRLGSHRSA